MQSFTSWLQQLDFGFVVEYGIIILASLLCIMFHEVSHGLTALKLGDPTAKEAGRLTFNPIKHVDIFGLLMMAFGFGTTLIVPVVFGRLSRSAVSICRSMVELGIKLDEFCQTVFIFFGCIRCCLQKKLARSAHSTACRKIFHDDTALHALHIVSGIFNAVSLDSFNSADKEPAFVKPCSYRQCAVCILLTSVISAMRA